MATFGGQSGVGTSVETGEIADLAVTNAKVATAAAIERTKLANVSATARAIGRNTAGAGADEEVTLTQILDWIGSAAQGDILIRGAATWARLGAGTTGQFLKTQGAGANPLWSDTTNEKIIFIPGVGGQVQNGAAFSFSTGHVRVGFSDLATGDWGTMFRAPAAANGLAISTVKLYYHSDRAALVVQLVAIMRRYPNSDGGTVETDSTGTARDYATVESAGQTETGIITLNADVDDALSVCATGDLYGIVITRNGAAAADTYGAEFPMLGVEITWA